MRNSAVRAFLSVLLVGALAGSAVAFAVGVNFSPHKTICIHPVPNSSYQICVQVPPQNVRNVHIRIALGKLAKGRVHLTFTNHNKVPVTIKLVVLLRTKSGNIRRITDTFTLAPGQTFTLDKHLKGIHIRGAKLELAITDTNGDKA